MKVGIVILNYNTWIEVTECVASIRRFSSQQYCIYIVDNCSKDDSIEQLQLRYAKSIDVCILKSQQNGGYSYGNNIGIKQAVNEGCNIVFVVNSDVELLNDAFAHMTKTLLKNDAYMMVGPSIVDNFGRESQLLRAKVTIKNFIYERHPFQDLDFFRKRSNRVFLPTSKEFSFVGTVSGCCFGMRAEDFRKIDYLDDGLFLYWEESILAYKLERLNKLSVFDSEAKVWHKEGISTEKEGSAFVQYHRWSGAIYMLKKYAGINTFVALIIAIWNILYWGFLSIKSEKHRKVFKSFCEKNIENAFVR